MITVRLAKKAEMPWINKCYEELEFVPSHFEKEFIAIAECNGEKAGLGRLVSVNDQTLELGGMFVFSSYRKKGVARAIVNFLLEKADPSRTIYCIPFQHLLSFYKEFGFVTCIDLENVPEELTKKFQWCKEKYAEPTALLILKQEFKLYYKETPSAKEEKALLEGVIEEAFKTKGLGRERKCTFATLTTMDWEALPFYQKTGYEIEHIREGCKQLPP